MARIQVADAQTWLDPTKATLTSLDTSLEAQISNEVLSRLAETYGAFTPLWVDYNTTPLLVKQVIAMIYAGWYYDRQYSEVVSEDRTGSYGKLLRDSAETLIEGIIRGSIILIEIQPNQPAVLPLFYPNDVSSTSDALSNNTDPDDQSLGPVMFGVSKAF